MIAFRDALLDAQLLRTIAHGNYRGAELGECLATAATIRPGDRDSWYGAWTKLAERTFATAEACERGGHRASARDGYLRASNYFRSAYIFHLEPPVSEPLLVAYRKHRDAFAKAASLMPSPLEPLAIPFGAQKLHGYFASAPGDRERRPIVISIGGYDSTAEESYFFNGAAAIARGYHCVMFDGPGQGAALFEDGIPFRPDWETAISAVLDAVIARPDVDPARIVVIGESLGGHLAPRGAHDPRIAALVVDPAQLGLFRAALSRVPLPASLKQHLPDGPAWVVGLLRWLLRRVAAKPTAGWALRRGMLTHGKATPWEYFADTARYTQEEVATITCPVMVCDAANDDISAFAREFYDQLTCAQKLYVRFTADEGAADHCVMGNRGLYHQRVFDWLDTILP